jgi:3-keto-5-aminohexanoate cleavage enzyme
MDDCGLVVIAAALNGGRDRREQPAVPHAPAEVVAEARLAVEVGGSVLHVHARRADGD